MLGSILGWKMPYALLSGRRSEAEAAKTAKQSRAGYRQMRCQPSSMP